MSRAPEAPGVDGLPIDCATATTHSYTKEPTNDGACDAMRRTRMKEKKFHDRRVWVDDSLGVTPSSDATTGVLPAR